MLRLDVLNRLFDTYLKDRAFRFLEIGPGLGDVGRYLETFENCTAGVLVDFSEQSSEHLKKRFAGSAGVSVQYGDIMQLEELSDFDVMLAFEVLEHVENDEQMLAGIAQKLVPGGLFFMSVPAYQKKWQRQDEYAGHLRRYERAELNSKLRNAGFELLEIVDYGFPLTSLMRPVRWFAYRNRPSEDAVELTKRSGVDRPFFSTKSTQLARLFYWPFQKIQWLFRKGELGDGLIVVARKAR
ncbi:class I SAM-dependent methyltransferase [Granulosicoccaceae sp. 1_MG-2023]|nr:class I SAM-dependent methyltransferase [Granulosicoccaceae sp. 1_MG-2023]